MSHETGTEASLVQPVKSGRGTRLSFLGGRRKDSQTNGDHIPLNGEEASGRARSHSKDSQSTQQHQGGTVSHRLSFFRSHSTDVTSPNTLGGGPTPHSATFPNGGVNNDSSDWVTESGVGKESSDEGHHNKSIDKGAGVGVQKKGSVRKRLSMLKLGRKTTKAEMMGALDEE